jgi:hypothetical protein
MGGEAVKRLWVAAQCALSLLLLPGCAAQLAPAYDQAVAGELATANNDIQALFVSIGSQTAPASYASRGPAYDHIVAELNATELEIKTRPTPKLDGVGEADKMLAKLKVAGVSADPNFSDYPSARAVGDLADTLQHMQADDQKKGLAGAEVRAYENQALIYLTQAITYENFLKR